MTQPHKILLSRTVPTEPGRYYWKYYPDGDAHEIFIKRQGDELQWGGDSVKAYLRMYPEALFSGPIEFTTEQES
jgi:hypothetical protein